MAKYPVYTQYQSTPKQCSNWGQNTSLAGHFWERVRFVSFACQRDSCDVYQAIVNVNVKDPKTYPASGTKGTLQTKKYPTRSTCKLWHSVCISSNHTQRRNGQEPRVERVVMSGVPAPTKPSVPSLNYPPRLPEDRAGSVCTRRLQKYPRPPVHRARIAFKHPSVLRKLGSHKKCFVRGITCFVESNTWEQKSEQTDQQHATHHLHHAHI